jgi:hypothetical protein
MSPVSQKLTFLHCTRDVCLGSMVLIKSATEGLGLFI